MSEKTIKVIDRRMFTAEGELREAYRDQVDPDRVPPPSEPVVQVEAPPEPAPRAASPPPEPAPPEAAPEPSEPEDPNAPQFGDLVGMLAQTGAAYIQQARATASPDMMQMARLHVDLLDVLERKTAGNLTPDEASMLRDVKRQIRLALG